MPNHTVNPLQVLQKQKAPLDNYLKATIDKAAQRFRHHHHATDFFEYLKAFVTAGKSYRGGLFLETYELFADEMSSNSKLQLSQLHAIAAALEMIHSSLLIEDDYMDQDTSRRGLTTFHQLHHDYAQAKKFRADERYGISSTICAADIMLFLAFEQLSVIDNKIAYRFLMEEYIEVGFSQWREVELSHMAQDVSSISYHDIEQIYRFKTARYSFTMPIVLAALLNEINQETVASIETITEKLGMIYQISDDYLNLFGDTQQTGKSTGSDISENKHTLYAFYLKQALRESAFKQHAAVSTLFGKNPLTAKDLTAVQTALKATGTDKKIEAQIASLRHDINQLLERSNFSPQLHTLLQQLTDVVSKRGA